MGWPVGHGPVITTNFGVLLALAEMKVRFCTRIGPLSCLTKLNLAEGTPIVMLVTPCPAPLKVTALLIVALDELQSQFPAGMLMFCPAVAMESWVFTSDQLQVAAFSCP